MKSRIAGGNLVYLKRSVHACGICGILASVCFKVFPGWQWLILPMVIAATLLFSGVQVMYLRRLEKDIADE
jgi:uncharacterized membrane protein HdeD (DUF308 family)